MNNLDVLKLPLYGINLIEASAGTGKTYNLIIIYLRFLLNLRNKPNINSDPLTIKNILVVTFTKSAAQELRKRIIKKIHQLHLDCIKGKSNNYLFSKLLLQITDIKLAINQLSTAAQNIDQASICTIHSFCQKIFTQYRIDLNIPFHTSIMQHANTLYHQIFLDIWRKNFYPLPLPIIQLIQLYWKTPEELLTDILPYIYKEIPKFQYSHFINESNKNISTFYKQIINCIDCIKKKWIENQHNIHDVIININNINNKIYNSNNIKNWIKKINQWSIQKTIDHTTPKELKRFRSSLLLISDDLTHIYTFSVFNLIEQLHQRLLSFKALIFDITIDEMKNNLNNNKKLRSEFTFDDLVILVYKNIKNTKNKLAHKIRTQYPVTIIDEFQDTDYNQYKIFQILYSNYSKNSLILIGDPKQSIYGFRGGDIFTYIKTRQSLNNKYYLTTNWRSSTGMVNAINQLFQCTSNPFIFQDIPFIPSTTVHQHNMYQFLINNIPQTPLCFWLHPNSIVTINDYKQDMATECAITLQKLIHKIHNKIVYLKNNKEKKILQISDITILVRNYEEASIIQSKLLKMNISTIFLSNRKNIFETIESYELLLLLKAILFPEYNIIQTALTTIFFKLNASEIEYINNNEFKKEQIFEEFSEYYLIWKNHGILSMIQKIIFRHKIPEKLLSTYTGKNNLINILHIGELLNNIEQHLKNKYTLVQWLQSKITYPHIQNESIDCSLRYDNNYDAIKISTIHNSKGLEFPLTFLPFIANFKHNKQYIFHDRKSFKTHIDFDISKSNLKLAEEERLAEDLRLLYVAITRSIYHCSIGIGPIIQKYTYQKKINKIHDLHHSALGYLIQNKTPSTSEELYKYLQTLNIQSNGNISFRLLTTTNNPTILFNPIKNKNLSTKYWNSATQRYHKTWNLTSYSALKHVQTTPLTHINFKEFLNINLNNYFQDKNIISDILTPHTFPIGKTYGIFFHELLKILDFNKFINIEQLQNQMIRYNINLNWTKTIQEWIYTIFHTPLNTYNFTLSKITPQNKKTEFKFYLPINNNLTAQKLDSLCKHYDPISSQSPPLTFSKITGMLQGFIDLVFYWNNQYYLLDYKTNWIGDNNHSYTKSEIEKNMIKYRYELQYQLYTLALHRFLQYRIQSYNYKKDFGGIFYLFIRGMDGTSHSNGIYFYRPSSEFIKKLDYLFYKK